MRSWRRWQLALDPAFTRLQSDSPAETRAAPADVPQRRTLAGGGGARARHRGHAHTSSSSRVGICSPHARG